MTGKLADIYLHERRCELFLAEQGDELYDRACDFVAGQFNHHFGATLSEFMPAMIGLLHAGEIKAVAGYRQAGKESLFLEQYLDGPIEMAVASVLMQPVSRREIVEVGNLAAVDRDHASALMVLLADQFDQRGFAYLVCTGTRSLNRCLRRLGLQPSVIAVADPGRIQNDTASWGSYYDQAPVVLTGRIREGRELIASLGAYTHLYMNRERKAGSGI
jgi:hypothetical protein